MSDQKLREAFESAFVAHQVSKFGEGYRSSAVHMLKRDGAFDKPPTPYELHCRKLGMYDMHWVEQAWWAWQQSRADLVIALPNQCDEKYQEYFDDVEGGCFNYGKYLADARAVIEAAGVRVQS